MRAPATAPRTPVRHRRGAVRATRWVNHSLRRFQVRFPRIDRDAEATRCVVPPQLMRLEHDRIQPLRLLAETLCMGIRKYMSAVDAFDAAGFPSRVARQARVMRNL